MSQANHADATDVDARHIRWIADIESDGSTLKNLSGRAKLMRIADGLSRAYATLTAELEDRAHRMRKFDVKELLDTQEQPDEVQADGIPGQQLPFFEEQGSAQQDSEIHAILASLSVQRSVALLTLMDHSGGHERYALDHVCESSR